MSENKPECMVNRFESDKAIMHLNWANRRMLIAIITVCITAIVISIGSILIFVRSYNARESNWQETFRGLLTRTTVTEVADGQRTD